MARKDSLYLSRRVRLTGRKDSPLKILADLKALGYSVTLDGDNIRLRYLGIGEHPSEAQELIEALKAQKAEAIAYLKESRPLPFLDVDGGLVIPFNSDPRFHWWNGGQLPSVTEKELRWKH